MKLVNDFSVFKGGLGILGGSFDPLHNGHIEIAKRALACESLDSVVFIPNRRNPLKDSVCAPDSFRLEMLLAACNDTADFYVSDIELRAEGPSYTFDTLTRIRSMVNDASLYFIMGSDSLLTLHRWHRCEDLFSLATFVTVARRDFPLERMHELMNHFPQKVVGMLQSHLIEGDLIDVSATELRRSLAKAPPFPADIPPEVLEIIHHRGNPYSEHLKNPAG